MGEPALAIRQGRGTGLKHRAHGLAGQQALEHQGIAAIGQAHPHAARGGDPGGGELGGHAAGAPLAATAGHAAEPFELFEVAHLGDRPGVGIGAWIARIEAVDIGEQHQLRRIDRHSHQGREGVVVAEAQLVGGEGVVLVDHRHHPPGQQLLEGAAGVLVAAAGGEIAPGEQHLGHRQAAHGEGVLIQGHQPALAHGRRRLQGHHLAGAAGKAQHAAAEPHGAAGDQGDGITGSLAAGQAGRKIGDHRRGGPLLAAPQQAGADFDDPPHRVSPAPCPSNGPCAAPTAADGRGGRARPADRSASPAPCRDRGGCRRAHR